MAEDIGKQRMLHRGFVPGEGTPDFRTANALEFIALYMERIDKKLDLIVGNPDQPKPAIADSLASIDSNIRQVAGDLSLIRSRM